MEQITAKFLADQCKNEKEFFYLASPYTNPDPEVVEFNYREVLVYSWLLDKNGVYHYCPIAAKHVIAKTYGLPTDHLFWEGLNYSLIKPARGIIIADIPLWERSKGVNHERRIAAELHKSIYLCRKAFNDPPALIFTRL